MQSFQAGKLSFGGDVAIPIQNCFSFRRNLFLSALTNCPIVGAAFVQLASLANALNNFYVEQGLPQEWTNKIEREVAD